MKRPCKYCKTPFVGRSDKVFCSVKCKSQYHWNLRRKTNTASLEIDKILHRNRSILFEIMGTNKTQIKVPREIVDKKKFNYKFHTHTHTNKQGKMLRYVYDFGWMDFSDQEILIIKTKSSN